VIALALSLLLAAGADPAAQLEEAAARDASGDPTAADAYAALLADGFESAALHVRLGNARLRAGERGRAIACYLRALRLEPRDAAARANLALARDAGPAVTGAGRPLLARIAERTPEGAAAALLATPWILLWAALVARRRARGAGRGALGAAAIALALVAAAGGALVAGRVAERRRPVAVVIARGGAPLRDGPETALRPALTLPEATEVLVVAERGEVVRVRIEGGVEGYVQARDVERL
jgi:hypothetical protein